MYTVPSRAIDINEIDRKKQELEEAQKITKKKFNNSTQDIIEEAFKKKTVGLTTREEFHQKQQNIIQIVNKEQRLEAEKKKLFD